MSRDHILTSQAGSLPRPDDLIEANGAREAGETADEGAFERTLQAQSWTLCASKKRSASMFPAMASSANRWATRSTIGPGGAIASIGSAGST